jgi:hypothetical protein
MSKLKPKKTFARRHVVVIIYILHRTALTKVTYVFSYLQARFISRSQAVSTLASDPARMRDILRFLVAFLSPSRQMLR